MSVESKDLIEGNESILGWSKYPPHDSNSIWSKQIVYKGNFTKSSIHISKFCLIVGILLHKNSLKKHHTLLGEIKYFILHLG
jgi:hypothetical protein